MAATKTAPPRKKAAPAKKVVGHRQPTLDPEPQPDDVPEGWTVDGLKVISAVRAQNLPDVPMNYNRLELEDGSKRYQCVDCPDFISGREGVRQHRRDIHGAPPAPPKIAKAQTAPTSLRIPVTVAQMSLEQILATVGDTLSYGTLVEKLEEDKERLRIELLELNRKYNALTRALDRAGFMPKIEDED